jgi:hypothetical protein
MEGTEKLPLSQLLQLPDSVRRNLVHVLGLGF